MKFKIENCNQIIVAIDQRYAEFYAKSLGNNIDRNALSEQKNAIAVIQVDGIVDHYYTQILRAQIGMAASDPSIWKIVIAINSPGGSVYGVQELADTIFHARNIKPIIAYADPLAASAAYWIGSAATKFYASPSADVGSIGVYSMHVDSSKAYDDMGIKVTLIQAGEYKTEGNPFNPLTEEAHANMQSRVDEYYRSFIDAIARYRKVDRQIVLDNYGKGRVLSAKAALSAGMIDGIFPSTQLFDTKNGTRMRMKSMLKIFDKGVKYG